MKNTKGFTLIELLIVIAIIGILSTVVIASLTRARSKGHDVAVKQSLTNARAQAELYYAPTASYLGVCSALTSANGISALMTAAASNMGEGVLVGNNTKAFLYSIAPVPGVDTAIVCHDSTTGWAAIASLKNTDLSEGWCVDSRGSAGLKTTLVASDVTCD